MDQPDLQGAFEYAQGVVRELMRGRERETRTWRLDVFEGEGQDPVFEIAFASVDQTLDHLIPELRCMVVELSERRRLLTEAVYAARATAREARALVARSQGKPYLASHLCEQTISQRSD